MMLNRRLLLAGAAMLILSRRAFAGSNQQTEALLALLPDRNAAAKIGAVWVEEAHKEPGEIFESLQRRLRWSADIDMTTLRHNLANAVGDDFGSGSVIRVADWQVAKTQAELCALAYFATR
jgi:hypothetical protein